MPILVIDDSLTIRKLLEMSLVRAGHKVVLAASGAEGVALARSTAPRLILLDFVLPDRRGVEVCAELAADPATANIPVVVMSAKGDADVRTAFKGHAPVAEFVAKPFAPAAIVHTVETVLRRPATGSHTRMAAVARTVAPVIAAVVPEPVPASTPVVEVVAEAVPAEIPPVAVAALEPRRQTQFQVPPAAPVQEPAPLAGTTTLVPVPALVRLLATLGRTGELVLGTGNSALSLFCDHGELVLVTVAGTLAVEAAASAGVSVGATGPVTDGEIPGVIPLIEQACGAEAPAVLHRMGVAALTAAAAGDQRPFTWHDLAPLPPEVVRNGRTITADQLALERLRQVDDWSQIEMEVAGLDQVCARAAALRERLPALSLNDTERRVLNLVNGRRSVRAIVDASALSTFEVFHALFRLIQTRLVEPAAQVTAGPRPVLWCGGADPHLAGALGRILAERGLPSPVAGTVDEVPGLLARTGARVVVVEATAVDAAAVARSVRARLEVSDATLVALVDAPDGEGVLAAAGFDAVLLTPVHATDLHAVLA